MALKKRLKCRRDDEERAACVSKTTDVAMKSKGNNVNVLTAVDTLLNLGRFASSA